MTFDAHNNRLTAHKGYDLVHTFTALDSEGDARDLTSGKAWYAITAKDDIGVSALFQYNSADHATKVSLSAPATGEVTITISAADLATLDDDTEYAWDAGVQLSGGAQYMAVVPSALFVSAVVNTPPTP